MAWYPYIADNKEGIRPSARGSHKLVLTGGSLVCPSVSPMVGEGSTLGTMAGCIGGWNRTSGCLYRIFPC